MANKRQRTGLRAHGTTTYRPELTTADAPDAQLLARAVDACEHPVTGLRLTQEEFARMVLFIDPRQLRRKLTGRLTLRPLERAVCLRLVTGASPRDALTPARDAEIPGMADVMRSADAVDDATDDATDVDAIDDVDAEPEPVG